MIQLNLATYYVARGMSLCLLSVVFLLSLIPLHVLAEQEGYLLRVDSVKYQQRISHGVLYLEDATSELEIGDLLSSSNSREFQTFTRNSLHFGYSDSTFWLRIPIINQLASSTLMVVDLQYPLLDEVDFYLIHSGQVSDSILMGDKLGIDNKELRLKNYVYRFPLEANSRSEIYIRVKTNSTIFLPLFVLTESKFIENTSTSQVFDAIYFGLAVGLLLYNLFLFFMVKDRIYLEYSFFVFNHILFVFCLSGYPQVVLPDSAFLTERGVYVFGIMSGLSLFQFCRSYLQTKEGLPRLDRLLLSYMGILLGGLIFESFGPLVLAIKLNSLLVMTGTLILFVVAVTRHLQGFFPARYFVIGQGAVLGSVIFTALSSQNILSYYHMAPLIMKLASVFELLFFSVGLAELINHERRLREKAQREAAGAQQKLLETQTAVNERLDQLVRQRTEELELANRKLEELNTTDELTGLRNRRYLNELLPRVFKRAFREKSSISVLILDIDFFKRLNDTYGHQFGDLCLATAGRLIDKTMRRPDDVPFRYGGEEFVAMLPNTDSNGARIVAEKIRTDIEQSIVSNATHSVSMTVSIGIASVVPSERDDHETLLKIADDSLYRAKEEGRNRVMCAS